MDLRRVAVPLVLALAGCDLLDSITGKATPPVPTESAPKPADTPKPADKPAPTPAPTPTPTPSPTALPSTQELIEKARTAGKDRAKLEAVLLEIDARLAAKESAPDHFLRAQLLDVLQRPKDALAALEATLRLTPDDVEAHHLAGLVAADLGREDDAFTHWSAAANGKPPHPGSAFNAGQYLYNAKRYEEALTMWRITTKVNPDDFDAAKKIVQALNALGRHDDAEAAKSEVKRIFASSTDAGVKRQNEFVIDQLVVDGRQVMIRETITPKDPTLHYHWTATVLGTDGKTQELTVQLETSAYGRERGVPYLNGMSKKDGHSTWGDSYKALPAYGEWRAAVMEKIAAEV